MVARSDTGFRAERGLARRLATAASVLALVLPVACATVLAAAGSTVKQIVFVRGALGESNLYSMRLDGSDVHALFLTAPGGFDASPSPDGREVAFEAFQRSYVGPGQMPYDTLWIVHPDGSGAQQLVAWHGRGFTPAWSPDSRRLLATHAGAVWVMNADGRGLQRLATGQNPAWSPDGKSIVFGRHASLWMMRPDGTALHRLHDWESGPVPAPAWSSDSSQIVVSAKGEGSWRDLYLLRADGTLVRRLTATAHIDEGAPSWAPARNIVFSEGERAASYSGSAAGTYGIAPTGRSERLMVANGFDAAWGSRGVLVYDTVDETSSPARYRLVLTGGGHGAHPLVPTSFAVDLPALSPDGSKVAFTADGKLAFKDTAGTGCFCLITTQVLASGGASWSPDGTELAVADADTLTVVHPDGSIVWATHIPALAAGGPPPSINSPSWAPVGATIAFIAYDPSSSTSALDSIPAAGGAASTLVYTPPDGLQPQAAAWSPDGSHIAVGLGGQGRIIVATADGRRSTIVLDRSAYDSGPISWLPDGSRILYAAYDGVNSQIFSVPASGGTPTTLTGPAGVFDSAPNA